jgi:dipeptidase D
MSIRNLEPKSLWNHFADLNAVPRPSKKEQRVIAFAKAFGESLGLPTKVDHVGNVIIKKPASAGMENKPIVALQSHLDMVHQKNNDTDFDFDAQGIEMFIEEDWVKAKGTTLGADNGIGVAAIMAILSSTDIPHPPIEALFTIDEETGMTGAMGLKGGLLEAKYLLNLDTEDDDEITIGCAGGIDVTTQGLYEEIDIPSGYTCFNLSVKGLQGGHSGMEIHKGLGNSNKLINRILWNLNQQVPIIINGIDGGGLRNAIPRESNAQIAIDNRGLEQAEGILEDITEQLKREYQITDTELAVDSKIILAFPRGMNKGFQDALLNAIYACPVGIYRMSSDIEGLVQTSNNLARVLVKDGDFSIMCLTRGSIDSEKNDLAEAISACFASLKGETKHNGSYPGWAPVHGSKIVNMMADLYREMFKSEPKVSACHAGLECGILGTNYPDVEMVSFGPNIRGAHSPDEKVQISSVQKFWDYFLEALKRVD